MMMKKRSHLTPLIPLEVGVLALKGKISLTGPWLVVVPSLVTQTLSRDLSSSLTPIGVDPEEEKRRDMNEKRYEMRFETNLSFPLHRDGWEMIRNPKLGRRVKRSGFLTFVMVKEEAGFLNGRRGEGGEEGETSFRKR